MILAPRLRRLVLSLAALAAQGCDRPDPLFRLLSPGRTGVTFANTITPTERHDFFLDFFLYNGAGVAVGDIDGDGLSDLYLTGNMVSSRLYRNLGAMRFADVTEEAGVATDRWATGASLADIDGDGDLDIHVSVSGPEWSAPGERANLLFVNDGRGRFTEEAAARGIADTGFTTHAVFLDSDRDGDLDLFLLANSPGEFGRGETGRPMFGARRADPAGFDRLYRNDGDGTFTDVSESAGILRRLGYGLGVVAADLNRDGWTDLYVSNDITPGDVLYINNRDGTFVDRAAEWLDHTSFAGMGLDIADFDNDAWPDIFQTDMSPPELADRKRVSGSTSDSDLAAMRRDGAALQYNVNTLQLNRGVADDGRLVFSEVARLAGVAHTHWSWSALFGDFDNDGWKDLFVTTGYPKAVIDFDFQSARHAARQAGGEPEMRRRIRQLLDDLDGYPLPDRIFRNEGDLTFSDRSKEWGLGRPAFSYGAAYADLDNDGRLDLVVNNLDAPASIYQNVGARENHYLQIRLAGEPPNRRGLGAKLTLHAGGQLQYVDHTPYRGYLSTVDDRVHFGLGTVERVDRLDVVWPDGRTQRLEGIPADRILTLSQRDATPPAPVDSAAPPPRRRLFIPADDDAGLVYEHRTTDHGSDYAIQPLLPYQPSRQGPPLAVADVDGDGLDDLFVGAAAGFPARLFLQRGDGGFVESPHPQPWSGDAAHEDWGALFFDADGDARPDLYVASGGYRLPSRSRLLQDRLYLNLGDGRFRAAPGALPPMLTSTAAVRAGDMNADGRLDLFVGGAVTPGEYPKPPRSYLLRNDGGRFTDVTARFAPELADPGGMITDALWIDFNGDGRLDLVTAGTWMPIRFYASDGDRLRDVTAATGLPDGRGWWWALAAGDLDGDGRTDLVAGNLGLNHGYPASPGRPFGLYAADFDGNRTLDLVFSQAVDGTEYPFHGLAQLGAHIEALAVRYPTFESFAGASVRDLFGPAALRDALHYQADTFASVWLRNEGSGTFSRRELPAAAQISPIHAILPVDVDGDRRLDLVVAGNLLGTEPNTPRADAGKGLWLRGDGRGRLTPVPPAVSGLVAPYDARGLALVETPAGPLLIVANHLGPLQLFRLTR